MALTREQKAKQIDELTEKLKKSQSIIFTHYLGMNVAAVSKLRNNLRDGQAEMKVAKKTLIAIAAKNAGYVGVEGKKMPGDIACILSYGDPLSGAQIAYAFSKENPQVKLAGGVFDGKVLTKEQALAFAMMPNRKQLLGMFAGMIQSPLRSFASICSTPLRSFAIAANELAKQKAALPTESQAAPA
jgi:large subunit ribosomal protein L10